VIVIGTFKVAVAFEALITKLGVPCEIAVIVATPSA
jgi:hypothetical protein